MKISLIPWTGLCLAATLLASTRSAFADPTIDHANPGAGSEVNVPPTQIKVWFSEVIDPLYCSLEVDDSKGNKVDGQDTHQDPSDTRELIISIPDRIYDGQYTVIWKVTTPGSQQSEGKFNFTVNIKD